jgi:hypothetical protein
LQILESKSPYPFHLGEKFDRENNMRYAKDKTTKSFDDYFPCRRKKQM